MKITNEIPEWLTKKLVKKVALTFSIAAIVFYGIAEIMQFGNVQYVVKSQQCGSRPVSMHPINLSFGGNQRLKYEIAKRPGWFDQKAGFAKLYCSVEEAKASTTGNPEFIVID